ncbi:MAG TPA: D-glycero-beta-D-manno-heptose 1-phosphate adenylyltransferase [Bacteroidetes bacterium]|nr:D-glycero-beta-D-manno-heptose 1-phosphate adenylyltransferase [Bacteroidota bacterium]HCN36280.1 D-glycero-beta-D-manno-heptose 1-phosphate adenylyltransferase [Bacteroidota bacterium]
MILNRENLNTEIQKLKNEDKKIVFTNGCFDILHKGHITYLNESKSLGDVLIVGVNSDDSVKKLKGDERPVTNENDRMYALDNLKPVDFVILFTEDTPYNLIKEIIPDILVKGGDWTPDKIIGSNIVLGNGGEVKSLKFVNGYSTTNILEKIKKL